MIFKFLSKNSGFSLLGILMALMAVSTTATIFLLNAPVQNSDKQLTITLKRMKTLSLAIMNYKVNNVVIPPTLDRLLTQGAEPNCAINTNSSSTSYRQLRGWCGPYIKITFAEDANSFKIDGWDTQFLYTTHEIQSCGTNKTCGDADDLFENF